MNVRIPFNLPTITGSELEYVAAAVRGGRASGDGPFTRKCEALLQEILPGARVLLTTSCTHALEMTALLLDLQPGDEVIVPSFTFVSTANAYALRGTQLVFADIRPDTLNLDERHVEALITPRTRAIVAVHYAGVACDLDALVAIAARHGLALIEDNAHGLFGRYRGRALGTFGRLATLSFHETKNISCGEGGALVINDPSLAARAEFIREKGTNRSAFFRGEIDKYRWVDLGSSYVLSDLLAAFLLAQLENREMIQDGRRALWQAYYGGLASWAAANRVTLPAVPPACQQPYHLFHLLLPTAADRDALSAHLAARGIMGLSHYVPLHSSPMARRMNYRAAPCPVTDDVSARLMRLPLHGALTAEQIAEVIHTITAWSPAA